MKTLVLLSGGLDSAAALALLIERGMECTAVGFDYGQVHLVELDHAAKVAAYFGVPFDRLELPIVLSTKTIGDDLVFVGRNLVLASMAVAMAQARGLDSIAVGCNEDDHERFPDCRPAFWRSLTECAETYGVDIYTPWLCHSKRGVVAEARRLGVPIEQTWSCYTPRNREPCGECYACTVRREALQ